MSATKLIAGHVIEGIIGQGYHSTIYKALHQEKDRTVALKVLKPDVSKDAQLVQAYAKAAQAVAKVSHPNIVRLISMGTENGESFIAMEFVEGPSLEAVLEKKGKLPAETARNLFVQGLNALASAEKLGLVHGSIRASHCLVAPQANLKLLDFAMPGTTGNVNRLPYYLSPEEASGNAPDSRSDLYSLGAVFYHALCGSPPFVGDDADEIKSGITEQDLVSPDLIDPDLPYDLVKVLVRLLSRDPAHRFASAEEALSELGEAMHGQNTAQSDSAGIQAPPLLFDEGTQLEAPPVEAASFDIAPPDIEPPAAEPQISLDMDSLSLERDDTKLQVPEIPEPTALDQPQVTQPAPQMGAQHEQPPQAEAMPGANVAIGQPAFKESFMKRLKAKLNNARQIYIAFMWTAIVLVVGGGGLYFYYFELKEKERPEDVRIAAGSSNCKKMLNAAKQYLNTHADHPFGAIQLFDKVRINCRGTAEGKEAADTLRKFKAELEEKSTEEWDELYSKMRAMLDENRFGDVYQMVTSFWDKYYFTQNADAAIQFRTDAEEQAKEFILELLEDAGEKFLADEMKTYEKLITKADRHVFPSIEEWYMEKKDDLEGRINVQTDQDIKDVEKIAQRIYQAYREEMQPLAKLNDHEDALKEIEKFVQRVEKYLKTAKGADKELWKKFRRWAEIDTETLEIARDRWRAGVEKWFEEKKGKKVRIGTTSGILENLKNERFFIRLGKEVFTEPTGMLTAREIFPLAFPEDEIMHGGIEMERGWWYLYQEQLSDAATSADNAKAMKADPKDLRDSIERWVYSGWLLAPLFTGEGSTIAGDKNHRTQLFYNFSSQRQNTDWFAREGKHMIIKGKFFPTEGGDNGTIHHGFLRMIGTMEINADVYFDREESIFRIGFMRPQGRHLTYHYADISCRNVAWWVGRHIRMERGNVKKPEKIDPLEPRKRHRVRLVWEGKKVTLYVNQRQLQIYEFLKGRSTTWVPLIGHADSPIRLDNVRIIGQPDRKWVEAQQPALWLAKERRRQDGWTQLFNGKSIKEGWTQYGEGKWDVQQEIIHGEGVNPTLETGRDAWRNYIFTTKVRIPSGSTIRMYIRRNPGEDGGKSAKQYVFTLGAFLDCGVKTGPDPNRDYKWFKEGDMAGNWFAHWHDLTLSAKGHYFSIFMDNRLYFQVEDYSLKNGRVALYTHGPAQFKDILIKLLMMGI